MLSWVGGGHTWRWTGDVPVDGCERVGTLQAIVPDVPGPLRVELDLRCGDVTATNVYETTISASR